MEKSLYRVTAAGRVCGRLVAPGDLLALTEAEARYEVDLGHLVATTVEAEARPFDLSETERAALPRLEPLGDGPVAYATGVGGVADAPAKRRTGKRAPGGEA
jgi:hypothetical protein